MLSWRLSIRRSITCCRKASSTAFTQATASNRCCPPDNSKRPRRDGVRTAAIAASVAVEASCGMVSTSRRHDAVSAHPSCPLLCLLLLSLSRSLGERLLDCLGELSRTKRLGQGGIRTERFRDIEEHQIVRGAAAGHGDDFGLRRDLTNLAYRLDAFLLRHQDVGDDDVGVALPDEGQTVLPVLRLEESMRAGERAHHQPPHGLVVIDDQDHCHAALLSSRRGSHEGYERDPLCD